MNGMPLWEQRLRAPVQSLPRWSRERPDRCVYETNASGIWQVHVWDVANGARMVTYAIEAPPGSGTIQVNGAAAHLVTEGDKVIICSYAAYDADELDTYSPVVVHVDDDNRSVAVDSDPGVLLTAIERSRSPSTEA